MHQRTALLLSLLPLSASMPVQHPAREAPPAPPRITAVSYSGNGCPSSSPGVERTGTWADLAFRLNGFEASSATGSSDVRSASVNCEVHAEVAGCAAGWQVGVRDVRVRGHAVLDAGAALDWFVVSYWSREAGKGTTIKGTLPNPGAGRLDADVTAQTSIPDGQVVWSACSGADGALGLLNVNFRVALQADGDQYGYFGHDADTKPVESWGYVWRRC
ncbi:hypothetical protein F4780DRAFT_777182 [Xylariomycetidae sp. FL0641]|nr:hypothetical protein F4780DRAFT_777182 [Xylariomycetidae sp. FL0641]